MIVFTCLFIVLVNASSKHLDFNMTLAKPDIIGNNAEKELLASQNGYYDEIIQR